jgi:hypothetical protein
MHSLRPFDRVLKARPGGDGALSCPGPGKTQLGRMDFRPGGLYLGILGSLATGTEDVTERSGVELREMRRSLSFLGTSNSQVVETRHRAVSGDGPKRSVRFGVNPLVLLEFQVCEAQMDPGFVGGGPEWHVLEHRPFSYPIGQIFNRGRVCLFQTRALRQQAVAFWAVHIKPSVRWGSEMQAPAGYWLAKPCSVDQKARDN